MCRRAPTRRPAGGPEHCIPPAPASHRPQAGVVQTLDADVGRSRTSLSLPPRAFCVCVWGGGVMQGALATAVCVAAAVAAKQSSFPDTGRPLLLNATDGGPPVVPPAAARAGSRLRRAAGWCACAERLMRRCNEHAQCCVRVRCVHTAWQPTAVAMHGLQQAGRSGCACTCVQCVATQRVGAKPCCMVYQQHVQHVQSAHVGLQGSQAPAPTAWRQRITGRPRVCARTEAPSCLRMLLLCFAYMTQTVSVGCDVSW